MNKFMVSYFDDSILDLEKLLLYMAFYGGLKERRLMVKFFSLVCTKIGTENDNLAKDAQKIIHSIYKHFKIDSDLLDREYKKLKEILIDKKIKYISILDDAYPNLLRQISGYPFALFYVGDIGLLSKKCVSVVGSRKATYDAAKMCEMIAKHLSGNEIAVASGLAFGVDSLIHKSCLRYNVKTISVLPSSVDNPIPVNNIKIAREIVKSGGLLISENPPGYKVNRNSYVERNRIISGISDRTLVVEAAIKSGSMTTAKFAIEQNRELYAMVGSISNSVAKGCNYLISQGAKPLIYAKDFYELTDDKEEQTIKLPKSDILEYIKQRGRVEVDKIITDSSLSEVEIISKLTEYEIFGYIRRKGNLVELV